jgi:glycosyltransferase involved in cell wall biosynthesis
VIDDGSSDHTYKEIKAAAINNGNVKYFRLKQNQGKGHALRKAFSMAKGDYICFLDGDLDLHPSMIKSFIKYMEQEKADIVIGSKRHSESKINYPMNRRFASLMYQILVKILFGLSLTDSQVGLKLFKKEVLDTVFHKSLVKKFAFDVELLVNAHNLGYKIIEAPITIDIKRVDKSEINFISIIRIFIDTIAIYYRLNILHHYDKTIEIPRSKNN